MTQSEIRLPDSEPMKKQGLAVIETAMAIHITDPESHKAAAAELVRVAGLVKSIKAAFSEPKRLANEAHKAITTLENQLLEYPQKADRMIRNAISEYLIQEERERRIEQARIEAEEKKRAEDAAIKEAEALEAAGDHRAAEKVLSTPVLAPVVEIQTTVTPGVSTGRKDYDFRIVDPAAVNRRFLIPDEVAIRKLVKAMGPDAAGMVGGIEVLERRVVAVRS